MRPHSIQLLLVLLQLHFALAKKLHYSSEHFSRTKGASANALALADGIVSARMNRCYSCMSPLYEELFKGSDLDKYFFEPRNFSAQCDDPMDPRDIGTVPCRGICLTLAQEFIVMGRKTGKRLIMRGCAASLSRFGYHNRTIAFFAEFDLCREVVASELFRLNNDEVQSGEEIYYGGFMASGGGGGNPMDGEPILVCSCLGDRCNRQRSNAATPLIQSLLLISTVLLTIFTITHNF